MNLQDLPTEVFYLILSNVSSDYIIKEFQYVSKYIYHLCSDELFWKLLSHSRYKNSPKLKSRFQKLNSQQFEENQDNLNLNNNEINNNNNNTDKNRINNNNNININNNNSENNYYLDEANFENNYRRILLNYQENSWKFFFIKSSTPRYLVIGSEIEENRISELKISLYKMGLRSIDHFNVFGFKSLTVNDLYQYDGILFFSYCGFRQKSIGNILSDYVDSGGGIVIASYSNCGKGNRLEGRWLEEGYNPFNDGITQRVYNLRMGRKNIPDHPILEGVERFGGGLNISHSDSEMSSNSNLIAEWENERPLIVELSTKKSPIIGLNFYPPSNEFDPSSWDKNTDGLKILFNSLKYVVAHSLKINK
ncbi:hypothetical protein ACTFIU_010395 [Dictyostelium citrinum]